MQNINGYMWFIFLFHIQLSRHARLWVALHSSAQPPSYPLSSAPQRFALAHQAPRESLLLAGGCGGSARDGGRLADGSLVCLMDWLMDAHCWLWHSSVVHIVTVFGKLCFVWQLHLLVLTLAKKSLSYKLQPVNFSWNWIVFMYNM